MRPPLVASRGDNQRNGASGPSIFSLCRAADVQVRIWSRTQARLRNASGNRAAERTCSSEKSSIAHDLHRPRHVAEPRARQFVRCGPRSESVHHGIPGFQKSFGILVKVHIVGIGESVPGENP